MLLPFSTSRAEMFSQRSEVPRLKQFLNASTAQGEYFAGLALRYCNTSAMDSHCLQRIENFCERFLQVNTIQELLEHHGCHDGRLSNLRMSFV